MSPVIYGYISYIHFTLFRIFFSLHPITHKKSPFVTNPVRLSGGRNVISASSTSWNIPSDSDFPNLSCGERGIARLRSYGWINRDEKLTNLYSQNKGYEVRVSGWIPKPIRMENGTRPGKRANTTNWKDPPFSSWVNQQTKWAMFHSKLLVYRR